jgi:predicted Na+-dependent transporter
VWLLVWKTIDIDSMALLFSLIQWIVIPFILAQITQVLYPRYTKYSDYIGPLTVLLVMPLIWAPIWANIETYMTLPREIFVFGTLWLFGLSIILHAVGRFLYIKWTHADRVSGSIGMGYMNLTIALLLASTYFGPEAVLVIILFELPWDLMLIPFAWFSKRVR